ncbi:MAG TPA: TIGR01777 family oxidoreductase [Terracidiphilus sp.]|nr:TIGR01777 family oxidoreductase [Terracidiphilus sp.]
MIARSLRIVIPGGSGQVGQVLAHFFHEHGHHVTVLTRGPYAAPWNTVHWDGQSLGSWTEHLEGADVCINLAGRSVNCRYTAANRKSIYDSRIHTTRLLNEVIAGLADPPKVWLNASTATIYRHAFDRAMDEATGELGGNEPGAPSAWNFSIQVARDWEAAFFETVTPRTRKVAMRSAITFSPQPGNPFAIFSNLVRLGVGGKLASGRQFVSWIHDADFVRAVEFLIARNDLSGPINIAAPHPLPNRDFMAALRDAWNVPNGVPHFTPLLEIAAFLLRTETELILKSRRVVPGRLLDAGFRLGFTEWPAAAEDLVRQWRNRP